MKKVVSFIVLVFVGACITATGQGLDSLVDARDGQVYKIKEFGNQTWMAENLNYKISKSWCYNNKEENCETFGRLYYQTAAAKACPEGWHLPSDEEWQELEKYLGMPENELKKNRAWRGTDQGTKLLSDSTIGFDVLLAGYRNPPSNNMLKDMQAFFWTSTEIGGMVYMRQFYVKSPKIFRRTRPKSWAFSVRCVKDQK